MWNLPAPAGKLTSQLFGLNILGNACHTYFNYYFNNSVFIGESNRPFNLSGGMTSPS